MLKTQPLRLAIGREWRRTRVETIVDDEGRGITTFSRRHSNTVYSEKLGRYVRNESIVFQRDSTYYVVDNKDRILKANETNVVKLFPAYKNEIHEWISEKNISFNNESNLRQLFEFLIPLVSQK